MKFITGFLSLACVLLHLVTVASFSTSRLVTSATRVHRQTSLQMKDYSVRIINKKRNADNTIKVPGNVYILDSAETQAVNIPYSCRAGSCSSCLGRVIKGSVDQSSQIFLNDDQMDKGYILTCVAYPTADCEIEVDIENEFYSLPGKQIAQHA